MLVEVNLYQQKFKKMSSLIWFETSFKMKITVNGLYENIGKFYR